MANNPPNQPSQSNVRRDLFLSYNSRDRAAVMRVRQLLDERNISAFFDRDQLSAGSRWVSLLENEVGRSRAVVGPSGSGQSFVGNLMHRRFALDSQKSLFVIYSAFG